MVWQQRTDLDVEFTLLHVWAFQCLPSWTTPTWTMSSNDEEDPFDVFGGDDGDDESDVDQEGEAVSVDRTKSSNISSLRKRAPENGFNLYHSGTEQAMIQFVKNELAKGVKAIQKGDDQLSTVIRLVDEFCFQRHWMMHIGVSRIPTR